MREVPRELREALQADSVQALSSAVSQGLCIDACYWHNDQQRNLLQLAAGLGAPQCTAALLAAGAPIDAASPSDGCTALHCACSNASSSTARVIALLVRGGADKAARNHAGRTPCELLEQGTSQAASQEGGTPQEGSDLLRPEYCTDAFRMYAFKIDCCPRLAESHDWTLCPFQHPGEKARRRDPRCYKYHGVPCPDFRKGTCKRGDACTYAHGVFECWLHPSRYRTQLCKEGAACRRSVCFFAHSVEQLREPALTGSSQPGSPRGPLSAGEESQGTPRSWSPTPATSEDSVKLLTASTDSLPKLGLLGAPALALRHQHSADSSLSSTPVVEGSLGAASAFSDSLQRTLSSLSLCSDDVSQVVALQAAAGGGPSHAALLAATAAASWPVSLSPSPDALALLGSSLGAGLHSMLLPGAATVQAAVQAAAMQHQLHMLQQTDASSLLPRADPAALFAATTGRQPLLPLSLNLGTLTYGQATAMAPSCYGLGL